jgi:hypothetical protein
MDGIPVTYNLVNLQTNNISVTAITHKSIPTKTLNVFAIPRASRSIKTGQYYTQKVITISGDIWGTNLGDINNRVDLFKAAIENDGNGANLDIGKHGSDGLKTRRYVAVISGLDFQDGGAPFAVSYSLQLLCLWPWGYDTTTTTLINGVAHNNTTDTYTFDVLGSTKEQVIKTTLTLTSFTGSTTNTIYFTNTNTGQVISISRAFVAGDVIEIDNDNYTVKVNGTEVGVDYDGMFSMYKPVVGGTLANGLQIRDDFTARAGTVVATQVPRWL